MSGRGRSKAGVVTEVVAEVVTAGAPGGPGRGRVLVDEFRGCGGRYVRDPVTGARQLVGRTLDVVQPMPAGPAREEE